MVDSIGRAPVGRNTMMRRKKNFLERTKQKMEQWRDKARINIFHQRGRYKQKVESNRALMKAKKAGRVRNLNPSATTSLGNKPKAREYGATHSTVSLKPKYSLLKPARRIYGNIWRKLEGRGDKYEP
jgi:hypothetical protein